MSSLQESTHIFSPEEWNFIVRNTRTPSINVAIQNQKGEILHVLRARDPVKGLYWLVGGRQRPFMDADGVRRMETMPEAAYRSMLHEAGLKPESVEFVGMSPEYAEEHFDTKDWSPEDREYYGPGIDSVDYITTVCLFRLIGDAEVKVDFQSKGYAWSDKPMNDHPYYLAYFEMLKRMGHDVFGR